MRNSKNMCRNNGDDDERDTNTHTQTHTNVSIVAPSLPPWPHLLATCGWGKEQMSERKKRERVTEDKGSPFHSHTDGRQTFAAKIKMERTSVTKTKTKSKNKTCSMNGKSSPSPSSSLAASSSSSDSHRHKKAALCAAVRVGRRLSCVSLSVFLFHYSFLQHQRLKLPPRVHWVNVRARKKVCAEHTHTTPQAH